MIDLVPNPALLDQRVHLAVRGLEPRAPVTIRASMDDERGRTWTSWARYHADAGGVVDIAAQASERGTYRGTDPSGLFWSMQPDDGGAEPMAFAKTSASPLNMAFRVERDGTQIAGAELERLVVAPGVRRVPVREHGVVGTFFAPAGEARRPAVVVMGGSGGGLQEPRAALLAGHGYPALALAYFGYEALPQELCRIPLEYFETAIAWLRAQGGVRADRIVAMGASRGGELALLLGALLPHVAGVIAYVPGAVVFGALPRAASPEERPAWTWRGQPVDFLRRPRSRQEAQVPGDGATALTPRFLAMLADADAVERVAIPVERIRGPVLLVSGSDDQIWPSTVMAEMVMTRLAKHAHPHPYSHFMAEGAGHALQYPYLPTTVTCTRHPVSGQLLRNGGTPEANAHGQAAAWAEVLGFLGEHVDRDADAAPSMPGG